MRRNFVTVILLNLFLVRHFLFFLLLLSIPIGALAQNQFKTDSAYIRDHFTKREMMIPMRDGKQLFTAIYSPKDQSKKYPILLKRTPYSCNPYGTDAFTTSFQNMTLAKAGYIFVFQDVRGKYMSEGDFVDVRPFLSKPKSKDAKQGVDEASDTYDTVDWLLKNASNNNGNVGVYGISYPGFYASMAILADHPAIKAVSPQAPVTDWFIGDDFHHNGALFLMDAFSFYSGFGKPRPYPTTKGADGFEDFKTPDNYDFYLKTGPLRNYTNQLGMKNIPFWNDLMTHPNYDDWWKARNIRPHLKNIRPAVMTVGGLFDAEDCWGAWNTYKALEKQNPSTQSNMIVMGPWVHGGWARTVGDRLGNVVFKEKTSDLYQKEIEFKFFESHLKGNGKNDLPEAYIFETGSNHWTKHNTWPPKNIESKPYYFEAKGILGDAKPTGSKAADTYISDPAKPVPYTEDVHLSRTREYMCDDQRFAARRPDVLVYETAPMSAPLTLAGPVQADLWVTLSALSGNKSDLLDADFIVKLIDVYPDTMSGSENGVPMGGYQMLVRGETMRGRFRNSFEKPEGFKDGEQYHVQFELPDVAHSFLPGHTMMIQVQSTWFPLTDRNPQRYVNIAEAIESDFIPIKIEISRDAGHPSSVLLPVLK